MRGSGVEGVGRVVPSDVCSCGLSGDLTVILLTDEVYEVQ